MKSHKTAPSCPLLSINCVGSCYSHHSEHQLYSLLQHTIVHKQKVGHYVTESCEGGRRWRWNIFPFSLLGFETTLSLGINDGVYKVDVQKFDKEELIVVSISRYDLSTQTCIAMFHPKHMQQGLNAINEALHTKNFSQFIIDDTLVLEVTIATTLSAEVNRLLYSPDMCGSVTRIDRSKAELCKWSLPYYASKRTSAPVIMAGEEWNLNCGIPVENSPLPWIGVTSSINKPCFFGLFIRNFVDPWASLYVFYCESDRHFEWDLNRWSDDQRTANCMIGNRMEIYFGVADEQKPNFGFDWLPDDLLNMHVNSYFIPHSTHHGFVDCIDSSNGLYKFMDLPVLLTLKGVLQFEREKDQDAHLEVTMIAKGRKDFELVVGIAREKHSLGHCGWFDNSIGYHFDTGEIFDGYEENYVTHAAFRGGKVFEEGDVLGLVLTGNKATFSVNGEQVFVVDNSGYFLPTITGVGSTFSVKYT